MALVALESGDTDCPYGGTRIDTGLDNGDGGETADDGVLGAGEVDSSTAVCAGAPGTDGTNGVDGAAGLNGAAGDNGVAGPQGERGPGGCDTSGANGTFAAIALAAALLRRRRAGRVA